MRLELRHLELVVAIADAGSLRRAAARLHLSQPAVTTQLKRIERFFGGSLFVRSADGVLPTHAGAELVRDARNLLRQFEILQRTARVNARSEAGAPVKVGGIPAQQFSLLVNALTALVPRREVTSRTIRETGTLTALLRSGELDVAVLREFPGFPLTLPDGVERRLLLREPIFVGVSEHHRLAGHKSVGLAELAEEKWVMPDPDDSGMNEFFDRACATAGFGQRITHFTTEAHVAFALVAGHRAICPLYPIGTARDGLATLALTGTPLYRELVLAWRTDSALAALVDEVCAEIERGYLALVEGAPCYRRWWHDGGAAFALP
ncbi:DNA-binding transcriptional regulator, LysR family [Amycolatopsis tolypomycina]|uniref:DNA-binding transcriptional regulator, LysR family n=1 Tax=Amycolatopsis tolypomycina TaxID=208445 RepID=A0A1H4X6F1_9PSEU|nr:LysR family transcriptional regulator [Amycolatopsis tolypomycina]SED01137.1 DNA-binding transcriptional regulator, LysR family [Amycolatopsis tolypomycina]